MLVRADPVGTKRHHEAAIGWATLESLGLRHPCHCIAPGLVYTPMADAMAADHGGMTEEQCETRRLRSLLHVEGTAWGVAHAALYLASDEARWVTGVVLPVDGGLTAGQSLPPR